MNTKIKITQHYTKILDQKVSSEDMQLLPAKLKFLIGDGVKPSLEYKQPQ